MKSTGKTILIGVGDEAARKRLSDALAGQGNTVYGASSGPQATDMVAVMSGKLDMLVIDLGLPPVNGYWVMSWLRDKAYDGMFPVAVLCGSAEIGHSVDEIKGKGASLVMTRDSKVEDVVYQINQELNRSKLDRAAPRVAVSLPAEISTASGSASSRVLNLSRSGAFIQTGEKHHANEELSLKITLPAPNAAVQATAAVRRIVVAGAGVSAGVGVEFTFMTDKARGALKAFLKDRETRVDLKGRFLQDTSG